jgi:hypothetical protein
MTSNQHERQCRNCGADLQGRWCSHCGQKVIEEGDRRFGHLLAQFSHELLHIDGKLPRTLAALLLVPGKLSQTYLAGQRVRYISPVGLFLIISLVYFLAPAMSDFNLTLHDQYYMQPYSGMIQPLIDQRLTERGIEFEAYADRYDHATLNLAKLLVIIHLPLLALALLMLFPLRGLYLAEHFIVATHLFAFLLIMVTLVTQAGVLAWHLGRNLFDADWTAPLQRIWALIPLLIAGHWLLSLRRAYTLGWLRAIVTTLALLICLAVIHFIFRSLQFMVVFMLT